MILNSHDSFLTRKKVLTQNIYHIIFRESNMPGKYIPTPVKEAIVMAKSKGQTDRAVANLFGVGQKSVSRIYNRHLEEGN